MEAQKSAANDGDPSAEVETNLDVLTFDGDVLQHVALLIDLPENVFKDFCRLAVDFLHKGPNEKRYNIAAEKLNQTPADISNAVNGILYLLISACKYDLNEKDFIATLSELGFSEGNKTTLTKFLNAKRDSIQRKLTQLNVNIPQYHNLNWRLEAQVSSRSLPDQVYPSVLLDLSLYQYDVESTPVENATEPKITENKKITHKLLQCDLPNLDNMIANLETALRETKFYHAKKIKTAITKK